MTNQVKFQIEQGLAQLREAVKRQERLVALLNELNIHAGREEDVLQRFLHDLEISAAPGEQLEQIAARVAGAEWLQKNSAKLFQLAHATLHELQTAFADFQTKNAAVLRELNL